MLNVVTRRADDKRDAVRAGVAQANDGQFVSGAELRAFRDRQQA